MSKHQKAPKGTPDTEITLLCARLVGLHHEQEVIHDADDHAPDKGPLHPRFAAINAEQRQIIRQLYKLGRPLTTGAVAALAAAAAVWWPKNADGRLFCDGVAEWLAVAIIQGLVGMNAGIEPDSILARFASAEASV